MVFVGGLGVCVKFVGRRLLRKTKLRVRENMVTIRVYGLSVSPLQ